ncbi:MAG TPA: 2-oxoglutarate and iron-dependent oxygenase domain-containing protein [Rhodopila sp.]|uniref:isopenicillin N synthase family dioxygenase n=1 Tax=Rhodopila sp. TaxID=2480087 RepID=UPI002BEF7684|nr:2-oxoglutarate and iron-dependent oxygenase domain-containing protein [Rhodopila sp.]HVY15494.1 2-oxoglutarate and iron-dependent oxygenase domain-containing protein [Rhodopila sp.]
MTVYAPSLAPIRHDAPEEIPVFDLGRYRSGDPAAMAALGADLRHALEQVGFYFVVNHGVPADLIAATFKAAEAFHSQPEDAKLALRINQHNIGYLPFRSSVTRHSKLNANNQPNLVEAFFVKREMDASEPEAPFRAPNRWPAGVPGFRETTLAYCNAMEALGKSLLPLYAVALGLAPDWFDTAFAEPMYTLRLAHYPRQDVVAENEFGLAPHSDTSFMTLLAQNDVPGLSIRLPNGRWLDAPSLPGSILVNGGDLLRRWTNDRFLATPHRVINRSGQERYAIPFFMDCGYDWVMECAPTCQGTDNPPKYPAITYPDYMTWFRNQNYAAAVQTTEPPANG